MNIIHDVEKQEFRIDLGVYRAVLLYARRDKVLDFYHIYVPDPFRSQGLAGKILIYAFEYAKKEGYRVVPTLPVHCRRFSEEVSPISGDRPSRRVSVCRWKAKLGRGKIPITKSRA